MKILFVCTANVCRSPLAEAVMNAMLREKGVSDVQVKSAGIHHDGLPRDPKMASLAFDAGYLMNGVGHIIKESQVHSADLIICMEHCQMVELQRRYVPYEQWCRIRRFNEICFGENTDLMDPSGNTDYIYKAVFDKILAGCMALVSQYAIGSD